MKLSNNEDSQIESGIYSARVTGALDLQWDPDGDGYTTITDASFTEALSTRIDLPTCKIKVINAGANTISLKRIRQD